MNKSKLLTILIALILAININSNIKAQSKGAIDKDHTALLIIDVQKFYFPGGQLPLKHPEKTSKQIKQVLDAFRQEQMHVIHIKHNVQNNGEIYDLLSPAEHEKVIIKNEANSFNGTELNTYLKKKDVKSLVITGMQTHMCVEATTRAAYDLGYKCAVISDACTTKDLKYRNHTIKAKDVHFSTLSSIQSSYGEVLTTDELVKKLE
jgi:nicotinamidase-related amidase